MGLSHRTNMMIDGSYWHQLKPMRSIQVGGAHLNHQLLMSAMDAIREVEH
jgi:hypothetical protein